MFAALLLAQAATKPAVDPLAAGFLNPPASARPHTWWHWMNGNVTRKGITADLEAMKAAGIGGAQMFTVDQGIPAGPAKYGGKEWRDLTAFAVKEAQRLGLELCLHNCAGWSSSGGPWVTPADGMQVLAWSSVRVQGPKTFRETLPPIKAPRVESEVPYAKDIAVYAYRTPFEGDVAEPRPQNFLAKTGVERGDAPIDLTPLPRGIEIPKSGLVMLTERMDKDGRLTWDVPPGDWTILRMGHVPVGVHNHPAPPEGDGLEVDKLSREAMDRFWAGLVGKVLSDVGPAGTKTLNNVLIDSYEVGGQNWTPKFREEFIRLRGYDPLPYLPVVTGRIVDGKMESERFLWDLRRTIADLFAQNYYGRAAELAHKAGLRFSTEPYGNGNFDTLQAGVTSDIPMGEFWLDGMAMETVKVAASAAHIAGRRIVGAESFTGAPDHSRWTEEPYAMKTLGDRAFCQGVNRYIFHRYAMQPWTNLRPGMTMGPWGTHFDRTQTWWTEAATWLKYVARCQYLLQQGTFQADVLAYVGEDAPNDLAPREALNGGVPLAHDYDGCDAGTLMRATVRNGRIVLPGGTAYRVLLLPETRTMTPHVARKLKELVLAGAIVHGPKPTGSPSLTDYPRCDAQVRATADELWGPGAPTEVDRRVGSGRVLYRPEMSGPWTALKITPDFNYDRRGARLASIHRRIGAADVYFVSNQLKRPASTSCTFRVTGRLPELWHPETGEIESVPAFQESPQGTTISLPLDAAESVFVVFRKPAPKRHLTLARWSSPPTVREPEIQIERARYETADGRGADVSELISVLARAGDREITASNATFGDPVPNVVKRLVVEYRLDGKPMRKVVAENETLVLAPGSGSDLLPRPVDLRSLPDGTLEVTAWRAGELRTTDGRTLRRPQAFANPLPPLPLDGPWRVTFPPNLGAPPAATFDRLVSWPARPEGGIRHFSGSATYAKTFDVPASMIGKDVALRLELGNVKNFATVTLNGHPLPVMWKPPFATDVSGLVRPGANRLEIKVTNLWANRVIGDERLPADAEWDGDHLKRWPDWLAQGKPRPRTGRVAFSTWKYYDKNAPLLDSGLLGPVLLRPAKRVVIKP